MGPLALVVLVAVVLAAGCGSEGSAAGPPRYDLTVTYWPTGRSGQPRIATLACDPDGGSHPNYAQACDALLQHEDVLEPVAGNVACTQIYGGDQVATLSGGGVTASFSRENGCEIARWDKLAPILELPG